MNILFSIIIPIFNSRIINLQIKSISNLLLNNIKIEIIYIDDGSYSEYKEKYNKYISYYLKKGIKIKYFYLGNKKNKNRVCLARNIGVKKSSNSNLIFIDQDTILHKNYINDLIPSIIDNNIIFGPYIGYNNFKKTINEDKINFFINNGYINENNFDDFRIDFYIEKQKKGRLWEFFAASNFFIKKDVFINTGGFDEKIITWGDEDVEFGYRLKNKGYNIIFNDNFKVLNLSDKLYKKPYNILEINKVKQLSNNWLYNMKKHNSKEYLDYILDRYFNLDIKRKEKISDKFKKFINKLNEI